MGLINRAFRNIFRKKTRTLLVAASLGFLIMMIIAVNTGVDASRSKTQTMIDDVKVTFDETGESIQTQLTQISVINISGAKDPRGKMRSGSPISQADIDEISSVNLVEDVVPTITQTYGDIDWAAVKGNRDPDDKLDYMEMFDYIVNGVSLDPVLDEKYNILPSNIVEGNMLTEDDIGGVLIKEELKTFFNAGVGDSIEIENVSFEIIGVYSSETGVKNIYMNLSDAQELLEYEGSVNQLSVYAVNESSVDVLVAELSDLFPDFYFAPGGFFKGESVGNIIASAEKQIQQLEEEMIRIESTGNLIILLSIIAAAFIILFMMAYAVKERTKEIGVLKAIGFTGNNIMTQFVIEGTVIGLLGGIIGIIIGFIATPSLSGLLFSRSEGLASTPGIMIIGFALCLTIVLGALGSLYPAFQASRKSPMEAMRND